MTNRADVGCAGMRAQPPADGILDLSMRLTVGFAQRFHRRPLPAAFAVWRQLVQQRRNCMCVPFHCHGKSNSEISMWSEQSKC